MQYNVYTFGKALLDGGDLDPLYEAIYFGGLDPYERDAFLMAYFLFYNAYTASFVAAGPRFWERCFVAFDGGMPRGAERRHFRTANARAALAWFRENYRNPSDALAYLESKTPCPFTVFKSAVMEWPQFGDWISFKVADVAERLLNCSVDFSDCALNMYGEPTKGALLVGKEIGQPGDVELVVDNLLEWMGAYRAPPHFGFGRPCGLQEVETVLCKYKSHRNGHYPVGKDRRELIESLKQSGQPIARKLLAGLEKSARLRVV